jgi:hypothetical protein
MHLQHATPADLVGVHHAGAGVLDRPDHAAQHLTEEVLDRPGVNELAPVLGDADALGVARGDVDALDAEIARKPRPSMVVGGLAHHAAEIGSRIERRPFDEMTYHAGVGPVRNQRGRVGVPAWRSARADSRRP